VEYAVQMGPMLLLGALAVGFLAEATWRAGGYGVLGDVVTGLAGGLAVGALAWLVSSVPPGMIAMGVVGGVGGALAIIGQRMLWRAPATARSGSTR
jgi:uncharacterized membrane protein YeaQ/YmgE (transglycosylase-associated protein family)